jgi:hypothetical protein
MPRSRRRTLLLVLQAWFGVTVAIGSVFEILFTGLPQLVPGAVREVLEGSPFMAAHHGILAVRLWVVGSNAINLWAGVTLIRGADLLWRDDPAGRVPTRRAAAWLLASTVIGQVVIAVFLASLTSGGELAAIVIGGLAGGVVVPAILLIGHRR